MTEVYRLIRAERADDVLSGEGAQLYGGRWNPPGYPVMYAGATIEICALEKFVHLTGAAHPPLVLVSIDVPDDKALKAAAAQGTERSIRILDNTWIL